MQPDGSNTMVFPIGEIDAIFRKAMEGEEIPWDEVSEGSKRALRFLGSITEGRSLLDVLVDSCEEEDALANSGQPT